MNNFKVVFKVDSAIVDAIVSEIDEHSELWDSYPIRTKLLSTVGGAASQCSDILLSYTSLNSPDVLECVDYPAFHILRNARSFVFGLMSTLQGERLGRSMITRLESGMVIDPHVDTHAFSKYYNRFHLCLKDNDKTLFRSGDEYFTPKVGDVFWFDNTIEHEVINNGDSERWTLIVDVKKPVLHIAPYKEMEFVSISKDGGEVVVREKQGEME